MKIAVIGTRGFPEIQGGVETHCEKLYPRLAKMGCQVTVFTRRPYVNPELKVYKDVVLIAIDCPGNKLLEAAVHTFRGVFAAKKINPDILHIHAIGPALLTPLARILGMKVVVTTQGPDYKREKWGFFAKLVLKLGERLGSYFANEIICVAKYISEDIKKKYKRDTYTIPNGVEISEVLNTDETLKQYGLTKGKYIIAVGRFVPEKGFTDLIEAFELVLGSRLKAQGSVWKLVIVGRADHESRYSWDLKEKVKQNNHIVLTGFLTGRPLQELYSHAGLFVNASFYEGLPITLLEAMSYGLVCLVSDIPANRSIPLREENYFPAGDIQLLSKKIQALVKIPFADYQKSQQIEMLGKNYNWDDIARKTLEVYNKIVASDS